MSELITPLPPVEPTPVPDPGEPTPVPDPGEPTPVPDPGEPVFHSIEGMRTPTGTEHGPARVRRGA